jgi:hypothetical protein
MYSNYLSNLLKDTFLQFSDINEGRKKEVLLKAQGVYHKQT